MPITVHAIFEHGVFRPTQSVDLPDRAEVVLEFRPVRKAADCPSLDDVYAILDERFDSSESGGAH
jgi:predicted DNA-binding antitoxin AbrB/MazE fold protein